MQFLACPIKHPTPPSFHCCLPADQLLCSPSFYPTEWNEGASQCQTAGCNAMQYKSAILGERQFRAIFWMVVMTCSLMVFGFECALLEEVCFTCCTSSRPISDQKSWYPLDSKLPPKIYMLNEDKKEYISRKLEGKATQEMRRGRSNIPDLGQTSKSDIPRFSFWWLYNVHSHLVVPHNPIYHRDAAIIDIVLSYRRGLSK